jgi:hypothetical protein
VAHQTVLVLLGPDNRPEKRKKQQGSANQNERTAIYPRPVLIHDDPGSSKLEEKGQKG